LKSFAWFSLDSAAQAVRFEVTFHSFALSHWCGAWQITGGQNGGGRRRGAWGHAQGPMLENMMTKVENGDIHGHLKNSSRLNVCKNNRNPLSIIPDQTCRCLISRKFLVDEADEPPPSNDFQILMKEKKKKKNNCKNPPFSASSNTPKDAAKVRSSSTKSRALCAS
jgi:hypothetical protein